MIKDQMEELYIKYQKDLYLYAFSLCKDPHLAQDLTSDTFYKAYLSLEEVTAVKYWLFRVCKNLYLDGVRRDKKVASDSILPYLHTSLETPLDLLIDSENKKNLYHVIIHLKASYKEVLILHYFCDFSIKEMALSMGLTEGATKTLLSRARKKLKGEMERENDL